MSDIIDNPITQQEVDNTLLKLNLNLIYYNDDKFSKFIQSIYINKNRLLRIKEIADLFGVTCIDIKRKLIKLNLSKYFSLQDFDMKEFFKNFLIQSNIFFYKDYKLQGKDSSNNIIPIEVDFYNPEYKIAFDINDVSEHNISKQGKHYYHSKDVMLMKQFNIRLIHFWEWEIKDDKLWYSKMAPWILNLFNGNKIRVFARKCECKLVPLKEEKIFLNQYHIQGYQKSEICLGLYYNNELVQIMSFCKPRYNKNYQWELLRLSTKYGYIVIAGPEELYETFKRTYKPNSILSYCNLDKFEGNVYERIGLKLLKYNSPALSWYNIFAEKKYSATSIVMLGVDKLLKCNYGLHTDNNWILLTYGYRRIPDCGQNVYVYNSK